MPIPGVKTKTPTKLQLDSHPSDKGLFDDPVLTPEEKRFIIAAGSCRPRGPFPIDEATKSHFSEYFYDLTNKAGVKIPRRWLCYSTILDCVYCEPCWLFADRQSPHFQSSWIDGIRAWRKLTTKIHEHEKSHIHLNACVIYEMWQNNSTIDRAAEDEILKQESYWRKVIDRLLNITITLATCNLPFRGHREQIGINDGQNGNFLSIVELLANYDPILKELIEKPAGSIRYLSPTIQNELINLLSQTVADKIISDINSAPFFAIIMDTTQDIAKVDQLSQVFRYVTIEQSESGRPTDIKINESFLGFKKVDDGSAEGLQGDIIDSIKSKGTFVFVAFLFAI